MKRVHGFKNGVVMVGDGGTDYEARRDGAADVMVGYGGVVIRELPLVGGLPANLLSGSAKCVCWCVSVRVTE